MPSCLTHTQLSAHEARTSGAAAAAAVAKGKGKAVITGGTFYTELAAEVCVCVWGGEGRLGLPKRPGCCCCCSLLVLLVHQCMCAQVGCIHVLSPIAVVYCLPLHMGCLG